MKSESCTCCSFRISSSLERSTTLKRRPRTSFTLVKSIRSSAAKEEPSSRMREMATV
jgi:hypothetical protein